MMRWWMVVVVVVLVVVVVVAPSQLVIDIVAGWLGWNDIISGAAGVQIWSEAGQGGGWRQVINIIALVLITNITLVTSMFICSISMEKFSKSSRWPPDSRKIWGKDHPAAKTRERRDSAYQGWHHCLNCHQCHLIEIYKTDIYFSVRWMRSWSGQRTNVGRSSRLVQTCTTPTSQRF